MPTPDDNRPRYDVKGFYTNLDIFQLIEFSFGLDRVDIGILVLSALYAGTLADLITRIANKFQATIINKQSGERYYPTK